MSQVWQVGQTKGTCPREVRTVACKAIAYLKITYGEYKAHCQCCKTFRSTPKDFHQASCHRAAILHHPAFQAVPELVEAMEQLDIERFPKLMALLDNPLSERVRSNNHVERTNRMFRFLEQVRYKWRRRRTLVRFVVLTLDGVWSNWEPPKANVTHQPRSGRQRGWQHQATQASHRVA